MRIIRSVIAMFAMLALLAGLTTAITATPANAADTGSEATFSSSFNGSAVADAKADAVAIAGADARGKILLEEFRAQIPQSIQDKWKPPTRAQIDRNGTLVSSLTEANAVIATQTKAYDKVVNKARAKIKKLKLRIKHKDGNVPKLKKRLKRAKKALKAVYVDKNWKYRPLIGLTTGICFVNRGLLGERTITDVQDYRDCVGDADHRDEKVVWIGLNPVMREMRIVAVELTNGTIRKGCLNVPDLVVPIGLPDESLFLVVKSIAEVLVDVYVAVGVNGQLVVVGVLKQNGETCDREEQTVPVSQVGVTKHVQVRGMAIDKAIAFAERQVQASASATAEAKANVQSSVEFSVSKTMTLYCPPTEKPVWMQFREFNDLEVNWTDDHCVTASFPSGSGTISWDAIYGSFATPTMPAKSGEQVCNWYKAPSEVPVPSGGTDTISVVAKDAQSGTTIGPRSTQPFNIDPAVSHPERDAS